MLRFFEHSAYAYMGEFIKLYNVWFCNKLSKSVVVLLGL